MDDKTFERIYRERNPIMSFGEILYEANKTGYIEVENISTGEIDGFELPQFKDTYLLKYLRNPTNYRYFMAEEGENIDGRTSSSIGGITRRQLDGLGKLINVWNERMATDNFLGKINPKSPFYIDKKAIRYTD
jgi:hypothetical protein